MISFFDEAAWLGCYVQDTRWRCCGFEAWFGQLLLLSCLQLCSSLLVKIQEVTLCIPVISVLLLCFGVFISLPGMGHKMVTAGLVGWDSNAVGFLVA